MVPLHVGARRAVWVHQAGRLMATLSDHAVVVNSLKKEQILSGVKVGGIDEEGRGQVEVLVRKDNQRYQFAFDRAIPGEKLHLSVGHAKHDRFKKKDPGRYRLRIHERGASSPDEVTPRCEHFNELCGGCAFQNLAYEAQLREKHDLLRRRLAEYGLDETSLQSPVPSPAAFGFHGRTEFRFFRKGGVQLGLHPVGSPVPIAIVRCELHPPESQRAFEATLLAVREEREATVFDERTGSGWLRSATFRVGKRPGRSELGVLVTLIAAPAVQREVLQRLADRILAACADVTGVLWRLEEGEPAERGPGWRSNATSRQHLLAGSSESVIAVGNLLLRSVPEASIRPNLLLHEQLSTEVAALLDVQATDIVWDAFCGQGLLSAALLQHCRSLVALDRSEAALEAFAGNAADLGLQDRLRTVCIDLGRLSELLRITTGVKVTALESGESDDEDGQEDIWDEALVTEEVSTETQNNPVPRPDVMLCDPGRNGMPKAFRQLLYTMQVRCLVYLAAGRPLLRDCTLLQRRGYELKAMVPFDSHPHSPRLEVAALLRWRGVPEAANEFSGGGEEGGE